MPLESRACSPTAHIRPLSLDQDIRMLHAWFTMERAHFWGMQDHGIEQVHETYRRMAESGHARAWLGSFGAGPPAFLFEAYDPALDEIGSHYPVRPGDLGMHCFVGPAQGAPIANFTRHVFRVLLHFLFDHVGARRIVVEPDLRHRKVHVINREMGFVYQRVLTLRQKRAALAICSREDFHALHPLPPPKETTA